jgi:hypothetical protein
MRMLLRVLAGKLECDLLTDDETASLADFLRRLAAGETVDEIFGIWRPANRPPDPALEQRLYEMAYMRLPVPLGGEGLSYKETIAQTAGQHGKSPQTIIADYKSERCKEVRAEVQAQQELAASLGFAEKWLGQGGGTQQ